MSSCNITALSRKLKFLYLLCNYLIFFFLVNLWYMLIKNFAKRVPSPLIIGKVNIQCENCVLHIPYTIHILSICSVL